MEEEVWVELIEEGTKGKYVSNFGNVKCDKGLKFSKYLSEDGYYSVKITYDIHKVRNHLLHRLVGKYFVEGYSEERCDINHKDGNKSNNHYSNLEWVTHQENMIHSRKHGLKISYSGRYGSQLNENDVVEIRILLSQGCTHTEIAKQFGVTRPCITQIASGNRWNDIKVNKAKSNSKLFSKMVINGLEKSMFEFANDFGINPIIAEQRYNRGKRGIEIFK